MKKLLSPAVGEGVGVGTISVGVISAVGVGEGITAVLRVEVVLWLGVHPPRRKDRITSGLATENKILDLIGISIFCW